MLDGRECESLARRLAVILSYIPGSTANLPSFLLFLLFVKPGTVDYRKNLRHNGNRSE
jgi:hypothetical protein